jgi:hypothetical protein
MKASLHTMSFGLKTILGHRGAATCFAVIMVIAALVSVHVNAAPVAVRAPEGPTHGVLLVRSLGGELIGQGEMTQVVNDGDLVESRLVFRFKDGSLHDETVAFSQQRVFTMISYRLVQRGPSFPDQIDVAIDRSKAEYTVRSQVGAQGKEGVLSGQVDLPKDVYNGMLITVSKNLEEGADETVSVLEFTPTPQVVNVQLHALDEQPVQIGEVASRAMHYVFKPQIGMIRELLGKATGKLPAQFHYDCWIKVDATPRFVKFEGPLQLMGQIVRIELVSPQLPAETEEKKISSK